MEFTSHNKAHYQQFLVNIFGPMSELQITEFFANTKILNLDAGDYLFKQGDTQNAFYIVLSGRFRALLQTASGINILGDVSAGEPVGELSLFTKAPRSASVVALRKSVVLQLNEADYLELVQKFPVFAHTLTNFVISRLNRNAFQQRMGAAPKNIAIINLQPEHDLSPWTDDIKLQLDAMAVGINVYYHDSQLTNKLETLFDEIENHDGINLLVCDDQHTEWANQCIMYCDLVLVVSDFYASTAIYPIEEHLKLYAGDILSKKTYLLLLHPEDAPLPVHTRRWFEGRNLDLHLHIRKNNDRDIRRFSRIITHQAVGLVLGGGGAKGFAHVGAAKAMLETGIEFDFVGGTSAGALYGTMMSFTDFDIPKVMEFCRIGVTRKLTSNDYNYPIISLMTGRKMRAYLKEMLGETHHEDMWINTYSVSTNYSTASLKIHETGLSRLQIEASIAIPGVFPPVIIDRHLHVDGGVMDNLPIEAMYQKPVRHVIAVSLSSQSPHLVEIDSVPSAWALFRNKFTKKYRYRLPKMASLLINSLTLNSAQKQAITKSQVSIYLEMDLQKYGILDDNKWLELTEKGYQQTQTHLEVIPMNERFWT